MGTDLKNTFFVTIAGLLLILNGDKAYVESGSPWWWLLVALGAILFIFGAIALGVGLFEKREGQ